MATIRIKKQHHLSNEKVKQEVQKLADKLSEELSAEYSWKNDRLIFKRTGASGHIDIGKTLQNAVPEDTLLIGSGFSFHNMKAFFTAETAETRDLNHSFESWLLNTCSNPGITEQERQRLLENWADAPGARYCHPREEHLLPLHVCYGFTRKPCKETFELDILGRKSSMYLW